jgi:hypothetical protein
VPCAVCSADAARRTCCNVLLVAHHEAMAIAPAQIAIDQDELGVPGGRVANWPCTAGAQYCQIWSRPLANGDYAVALYNAADDGTHDITVSWDVVKGANWTSTSNVAVRDVWCVSVHSRAICSTLQLGISRVQDSHKLGRVHGLLHCRGAVARSDVVPCDPPVMRECSDASRRLLVV